MVHFVGAGSGAADLITVRGVKLLGEADVVIYAGSLVNPALLDYTREGCEIHDSAKLTLESHAAHPAKSTATSSFPQPSMISATGVTTRLIWA